MRIRSISVSVSLLILLLSNASVFSQSRTAQGPPTLIIEFDEIHDELAEMDKIPRLRIYSSGLARIHYPVFMKMAGDYETHLSSEELDEILMESKSSGILEFNAEEFRKELNAKSRFDYQTAAKRPGSVLETRIDQTITTIRFLSSSTSSKSNPGNTAVGNELQTIRWRGLRTDAKNFPELEILQSLVGLTKRLRSISERKDLTKIPQDQ